MKDCKRDLTINKFYKTSTQLCKNEIRKTKVENEVKILRKGKFRKNSFFKDVNNKRKIKEVSLLTPNGEMANDQEKKRELSSFLKKVFCVSKTRKKHNKGGCWSGGM